MTKSPPVFGKTVDEHTRCEHYSTVLDIIAIRFSCCDRYYPCHLCHSETADHSAGQWPRGQWNRRAILCGMCWTELTVDEYLSVSGCPNCSAMFNPGCRAHSPYYFVDE